MQSIAPDRPIHVAAGILHDSQGRVLIAQRPPGRIAAGKWEFPGGKLDPQEGPYEGLIRELREELGIAVHHAHPLIQIHHAYSDRRVLLDVWRVTHYAGVPHGCEGQALQWLFPDELDRVDLLEADAPIVRALKLPSLYVITDAARVGERPFLQQLEQALAAGATLVQLREPGMGAAEYQRYAREVADLCHRFGARLLLNSDPAWVGTCGADGVHLNGRRLRGLVTRPLSRALWVAASCHDADELAHAAAIGVDFAVLGPVLPTPSHAGAPGLGWSRFRELCAGVNMPVYALGGLSAADLAQARNCGAQGLAMISGIWQAQSIAGAVSSVV